MGVGTNFPKNRPRAHMGVCIKKSPRRVLHARTRPLWACALENRDQCAFNNKLITNSMCYHTLYPLLLLESFKTSTVGPRPQPDDFLVFAVFAYYKETVLTSSKVSFMQVVHFTVRIKFVETFSDNSKHVADLNN